MMEKAQTTKAVYHSPRVTTVEFIVEQGYAASPLDGLTNGFIEGYNSQDRFWGGNESNESSSFANYSETEWGWDNN